MVTRRPIVTGLAVGAVFSTTSMSVAQTIAQGNDRSGDPDIPTGMAYPEPHCFVDSVAGNDSGSGSSEDDPWASLSPARSCGTVYLKKGSTFDRISPQRVTISTYGTGARPVIQSSVSLSGDTMLEGVKVDGTGRIGVTISGSGNVVSDCEIDGRSGTFELGFGVMGAGNLIIGNDVHHLSAQSGDSGDMNTSGGAEAYMIMGSNNEIAYNSASEAHGINETLGGEEGGCYEIVNGQANAVIEDVYFHHNYCERSIGLWEGCSGNFQGTDKIQENHGIIRNVVLAYNLSVDAMWLYLLQPVNTDFDNVVFEHNTLIHTPANDSDFVQAARNSFGLQVTEDQGYTGTLSPGNIIVRNNLFWVTSGGGAGGIGAGGAMMQLPPDGDHYNNVFAGWSPGGTLGPGEIRVDDPGLSDTYRLLAGSPLIDAGAGEAWQAWKDYDANAVPLAAAPDVGAFEFCDGADCNAPSETPPSDTSDGGGTPDGGATGVPAEDPQGSGGTPPATGSGSGGTTTSTTPATGVGGGGGTSPAANTGTGGGAAASPSTDPPTSTPPSGDSVGGDGQSAPGSDDGTPPSSDPTAVGGATSTDADTSASGGQPGSSSANADPSAASSSSDGEVPTTASSGEAGAEPASISTAADGDPTEGDPADAENGTATPPSDAGQDSGCGCRIAPQPDRAGTVPWWGVAGLIAIGLAPLRRRRRVTSR